VWLSLAVLFLSALSLSPHLTSSSELVRVRNALLVADETTVGFDWTPANWPADFLLERGPADPVFVAAAQRLGLADMRTDWERVTAISQHLLSHPKLVGTPIQSNLTDTYRQILDNGTGYCGDFTRVFMAFAITAGIPVRAWAFTSNGFGGEGHVWPEIWNRQLNRWQLVDIFNNFYFHDNAGVPVSALEFREAMLNAPKSIRPALLYPGARPGYAIEEKMWAWYRKGLPEWHMLWGNNVFSYDQALKVRGLGRVSRSLEQLEGIYLGVHPKINLMVNDGNRAQAVSLLRLRSHLEIVSWTVSAAILSLLFCVIAWLRARGRVSASGAYRGVADNDA
jgi:Transglutaminase-like superfamily